MILAIQAMQLLMRLADRTTAEPVPARHCGCFGKSPNMPMPSSHLKPGLGSIKMRTGPVPRRLRPRLAVSASSKSAFNTGESVGCVPENEIKSSQSA